MSMQQKIFHTIKALVISVLITMALLLLLAFAFWKVELSDFVIRAAVVVIYVISSFGGGFCEGKLVAEKKYIWGIIIGVLYFLLLCVFTVTEAGFQTGMQVRWYGILFICVMSGMLGGMIA